MMAAVGPLEDLLFTHGDAIVDALVTGLRRSPRLVEAFGFAWIPQGSLSPESVAALSRFHRPA